MLLSPLASIAGYNSVQWKLNGSAISGATSTSYSTSSPVSNGSYTCDIVFSGCSFTTKPYVFYSTPATPTITSTAPVAPSCNPSLTATGICLGSMNWYRNGNLDGTTTGSSPYIYSPNISNNTDVFTAKCIANGCLSSASNSLSLTPGLFATVTAPSLALCPSGSVTLTANSTTTGLTYQWYKNSVSISGATASTYAATTIGSYYVVVSNGTCSYATVAVSVTNATAPTLSITSTSGSSPLTIVNGQSVTLNSNGCTGGTVLWSNSATTASTSVSPSTNTTYTFTCTLSGCTFPPSGGFTINVNPLPSPTITSSAVSTCTGTSVNITGVCPNSSTISWNTSPVQTTSTISVSPSTTTTYTATCTLNTATSSASTTISVFDGAITSLSSGDWTNPATWSCNCIPAPCNDVTVEVGHIVNIPVSLTGRLNNLTVKGSVDLKNSSTMKMK